MHRESRPAGQIAEQAAAWFAKRDAGRFSSEDQQALDAWLSADPAHRAAWATLERLWSGLAAVPPAAQSGVRAQADRWRASRTRRRIGAAVTGGAALCLALAAMSNLPMRLRADAMTGTGEQRSFTLTDGSVIRLNSDSAVAVEYSDTHRKVRLLSGEAAFEVKPDPARSFSVEAGGGTATALGTRYLVRLQSGGARVTVIQHRVVVHASPESPAVEIDSGQRIDYHDGRFGKPSTIDIPAESGWLRGKLVFHDRPLGEVVAEISRYHPGVIRVLDKEVATRRISGVFPTNDPVGAIDSLEHSFGTHSWRLTNHLILITR